jgi:hypothetical protein
LSFYVSDTTIEERARLLIDVAHSLIESGPLAVDGLILRESHVRAAARAYFLLNRAYKDWRLPDGHFTEKPKIAALQCIAIARIQPLLPPQPDNVTSVAQYRCNEIFALTYALGILEQELSLDCAGKIDLWLRILDIIAGSSAETIEPYLVDVHYQIIRPLEEYKLEILPQDKIGINSLITIFELIGKKHDL